MTLSMIRDVETATIPSGRGQPGTTLQIPVVAKTQLNMNVATPSGKTLVIGGLKTTDKQGKEQAMLVLLRPTALAPAVGAPSSGRRIFGLGVNSDAGVTGTIMVDPEKFAATQFNATAVQRRSSPSSLRRPIVAAHTCREIEPPSDDEVIRTLDERRKLNGALLEVFVKNRKSVRIVKEKTADCVDPPRSYPLIGPAQLHHSHYKCTVYFTKSMDVKWPIPHKSVKEIVELVYIETNHFHKLENTQKDAATLEMRERLKQKINVSFEKTPLSEVLDKIGRIADLNIMIDTPGIHEEGITANEPITINLSSPISVKSALILILEPLHLDYMIVGEVLKITSETRIAGRALSRVYNVADLVIPIPSLTPVLVSGTEDKPATRMIPDFEALIDLITSTVAPSTWEDVGGPGAIEEFPTNLSLVISQTEGVHEQVADLLKQLRRLRDVQVTLSLKTIRVSRDKDDLDSIWPERMGESTIRAAAVADALRSVGKEHRGDSVVAAPKMTLFNGQQASLRLSPSESERMNGVGVFHVQPVVSDDRRSVRLTFVVEGSESGGNVPDCTTNVVSVGESLVVDITERLAAQQRNKRLLTSGDKHSDPSSPAPPDTKIDSGERLLVIVTPQIIVHEEEAAEAAVPGTRRR